MRSGRRKWATELDEALAQLAENLRPGPLPASDHLDGFEVVAETARSYFDEWRPERGLSKVVRRKEIDLVKRPGGTKIGVRFSTTG